MAGWSGYEEAWTPWILGTLGGTLAVLVISILLASRKPHSDEGGKPLPGEVYEDREAPDPNTPQNPDLDGVPFSESKDVTASTDDPRRQELEERLEVLNKQLQRANVKLGLGELSREGYSKIVEELKERRARVEAKLNGGNLGEGKLSE